MKPVLRVEEMRAIDADALRVVSEETLVERAGTAVATWAVRMLGGTYGRHVVVVAGKGNNGADGRVAAARLRRRGARVTVVDASDAPERIGPVGAVDLVIDASYGTGFRGTYRAPAVPAGVPVLAVDIPSGVNGDTGEACGEPLRADVTVTFAALKTGLVQGDGPLLAGQVEVADIGLDVSRASIGVIEDADVEASLPPRPRDAHKWQSAVAVVAGSPGMTGAAGLCARAAYRSGAGMVRLGIPGGDLADLPVSEAVGATLPFVEWSSLALTMAERCRALVMGPGLGRADTTVSDVRDLVARATLPMVVDADGLYALGTGDEIGAVVRAGPDAPRGANDRPTVVLTPHDGEFTRLAGAAPGTDRIAAACALAARCGAVVLLKGATTVVADPAGTVLLAMTGSPRLATAGTGDVLSGVIGAFIARGIDPVHAAAMAAHVHGRAAQLGPPEGLVAGDLAHLVGTWLSEIRR
jgi:NAD(P)H-hydrate epimerase